MIIWNSFGNFDHFENARTHNVRVLARTVNTDLPYPVSWAVLDRFGGTITTANPVHPKVIGAIGKFFDTLQIEGHVPPDNEIYDDDVIEYLEKKMTTNKKTLNKPDAISRIQNGTRDTAMAFSAFKKADTRLAEAVKAAREVGVTEQEVHNCIASAARGNPRVRDAVLSYSKWLQENNSPPN
jgi:hypothetical protein